jgi:hypothetical protein
MIQLLRWLDGKCTCMVAQVLDRLAMWSALPPNLRRRLALAAHGLLLSWFARWGEDDGWIGVLIRLRKGLWG